VRDEDRTEPGLRPLTSPTIPAPVRVFGRCRCGVDPHRLLLGSRPRAYARAHPPLPHLSCAPATSPIAPRAYRHCLLTHSHSFCTCSTSCPLLTRRLPAHLPPHLNPIHYPALVLMPFSFPFAFLDTSGSLGSMIYIARIHTLI
jgi:hypothetical protein